MILGCTCRRKVVLRWFSILDFHRIGPFSWIILAKKFVRSDKSKRTFIPDQKLVRGLSATLAQRITDKEVQNERAVQIFARVKDKLMSRDSKPEEDLDVERQVAKLVAQATNVENLCQHYIGWCSFW